MAEKLDDFRDRISGFSRDELAVERKRLEGNLEDVQTERHLIIGQTGVHINATKIQTYRDAFDRDEARLSKQIALIDEMLKGDG